MPRIRCHCDDCAYWDDDFCSARRIELDPQMGCLTYHPGDGVDLLEEDWEDDLFDPDDDLDWDEDDEDT